MLGFSFSFRFRSRLLRLPGFDTACWHVHCNSFVVVLMYVESHIFI